MSFARTKQRRKSREANTLAGATYQHSLSAEMQAVTGKAQALNDVDLSGLRQLRLELRAAQQAAGQTAAAGPAGR